MCAEEIAFTEESLSEFVTSVAERYAGSRGGQHWCAACNNSHGLIRSWFGPDRPSYAEAKKDADAHNKELPGHRAFPLGPLPNTAALEADA